MKKTACLVCTLFLLLTVVSVPAAFAMEVDYTGEWVCLYVDTGDGVPLSEYEGQPLQEAMRLQLNADSSYTLNSFGVQQTGTWQTTGAGIATIVDGIVVAFSYQDDMLVNTEGGVTMYFGRAAATPQQGGFSTLLNLGKKDDAPKFDFAGSWNCISYEASGVAYDISMFFPDGITMTLNQDGTGSVQLTPDYAETITWAEADGAIAIDGSNMLFDPIWDADANTLSLCYTTNIVRIVFEKIDEGAAVTPNPSAALPQVYTCDYFAVAFPEIWGQVEYNTYNWDGYYSAQYSLMNNDGWTLGSVQITASVEEVGDYRSGIDELLEYAGEAGQDTLDEITIGGVAFRGVTYGESWVYTEYLARVPEASITIKITITDPENIQDVLKDILASISFTYPIPNPPLMDPPMPEDGVAFQPSPTTQSVGGYDLTAEWLSAGTSIIPKDEYNNGVAATDGTVYVLASNQLYVFDRSGTALTAAGEPVELGNDYKLLSAVWDGTLYITDGFYSAIAYKDGAVNAFELDGYLAMSPEGLWGLSYWSSYTVKKITLTPDGMAAKDWVLKDLSDDAARQGRFSSVSYILITADHIFVAGTDATTEYATRIAMYDFEGNELAVFGSEDWTDDSAIGSVSGIVQTNSGILVQDSVYQCYMLFAMDGSFLGKIGCDELLGTNNPWPVALTASDNGALALLAQMRDDGSAVELLVYELTGF